MKVLFAVSNENISESIIRKYQKEYKEIISSKNVYYFNAIQKELQNDNAYDRIVVSEDLEPFTNNNYDAIDRFIFDKLDSISDEAINSRRSDTPIILICSDRRAKSEEMLVKLFSIGIYNAVLGNDRSIGQICDLIRKPRTKKEAKAYYNIDTDDVKYTPENEDEVSEVEIQNILNHYKKLGRNEDKYAESFENIASQYNEEQLKLITSILPLNVKAVLEMSSPTYQKIMTASVSNYVQKQKENSGISMNFIPDKTRPSGGKIVVPTAVSKNNIRKVSTTPEPVLTYNEENTNFSSSTINQDIFEPEGIIEAPKRRGRPRKNPINNESVETNTPKRRGRPKKTETQDTTNLFELADDDTQKQNKTSGFNGYRNDILNSDSVLPGFDDRTNNNNSVLPGFDDNTNNNSVLPGFNDKTTNNNNNNNNNNNSVLPGFDDNTNNNSVLPGFDLGQIDDNKNSNSNVLPGFENSRFEQPKEYENEKNESNAVVNLNNKNSDIQNLLTSNKKIVTFVGTSKNGTSFIVNNAAEALSRNGINVAILDTTKNKNSYYIYTQNEEQLRNIASESIRRLQTGIAQGLVINKNLTVYTALPDDEVGLDNYQIILKTLLQNHDLILIDCDFKTNEGYFAESQEIYLVQSLDVLTIQPLTSFLRDLKAKNILNQEKIRIVINKNMKVRGLTDKAIIGGMSYYNEPSMSFMTELFNRDLVRYFSISFESQIYSRYLEGLVNCKISLNGYSKSFLFELNNLCNTIYPLINGKNNRKIKQNNMRPVENYEPPRFSQGMNDTLNQMKKNF